MERANAARLLQLTLPTTAAAIKTAFRRRALQVHPDQNKAAGAQDAFIDLQEACSSLLADPEAVTGVEEAALCVDGTPLKDLGGGLGPTVNGKPCPKCNGAGFTKFRIGNDPCPDCRPLGFGLFFLVPSGYEWKCPRCNGTGRFKRNGKDVGECFRCKGRGTIRTRTNQCETCHGTGRDPRTGTVIYHVCQECQGTGEVKVLNPVLPKGLFTGGTASSRK